MNNIIKRVVFDFLYFSGLSYASGRFSSASGAILGIQRVRKIANSGFDPNRFRSISPEFLDHLLSSLKEGGLQFVSVAELISELNYPVGNKNKRCVSVVLDQAYQDTIRNAVPVLKKHEIPFTLFISPGLLDGQATLWWEILEQIISKRKKLFVDLPRGRIEFETSTVAEKRKVYGELYRFLVANVRNDVRDEIMSDLSVGYEVDQLEFMKDQMMTWSQVCGLSTDPLCTLGATSLNDRVLSRLSEKGRHFEIDQARKVMKLETGVSPDCFLRRYPENHDTKQQIADAIEASGYTSALSCECGLVYPRHKAGFMELPHIALNGEMQKVRHVKAALSGLISHL